MRSRFAIALAVAVAVAVVFATTGSAASLPGIPTACTSKSAKVKPHRVLIACGDGAFYVTGLRWSSWSGTGARGRGTAHQNDCVPFCAAGHFHAYRGLAVRLSRPKTCKGRLQFTRLSWRFGTHRPARVRRTGFQLFPCL